MSATTTRMFIDGEVRRPAPDCSGVMTGVVEADVPPGVFNFVLGPRPALGDEIRAHPRTGLMAAIFTCDLGRRTALRRPRAHMGSVNANQTGKLLGAAPPAGAASREHRRIVGGRYPMETLIELPHSTPEPNRPRCRTIARSCLAYRTLVR